MVRILKVKHLEERRRLLVTRSEIYRHALRMEVASLKFSAMQMKQRFGILNNARRLLGLAASVAGLYRRQTESQNGNSIVARVLSGLKFAAAFVPLLKMFGGSTNAAEKRDASAATADSR